MKQIISVDEAAGKTVESVELFGAEAAVLFTDGTVLVLQARYTDDCCREWEADQYVLTQHQAAKMHSSALFVLGLVDQAERDRLAADRDSSRAEAEMRRKRALLQQLRRELGEE